MRKLQPGQIATVEGEALIEGGTNREATVSHISHSWRETREGSGAFGVMFRPGKLVWGHTTWSLQPMQYFAVPTPIALYSNAALLIILRDYRPLISFGGPTEQQGRLRYIDGCTDTLLIGPPVVGDPCLNLLHFPPHVEQTMHVHPSLRCGMTLAGHGVAEHPEGTEELRPGDVWFLPTGGKHRFCTKNSELLVTAWHPDSDTGPAHDDHPMLNRTMVNGVSAKDLPTIRTR